jgi:alpha-D-ribose 1-methylphosphonate 5-triphosphate synthase subunit PhnH
MNTGLTATLAGGFRQPVFDSQRVFRATMDALANPGTVQAAGAGLDGVPLPAAAAAVILALCDYETPLYLGPAVSGRPGVAEYLGFHTDARIVAAPSAAAFALVDLARDALDLSAFAQGTPEYPDRSTTVVALTSGFAGSPALTLSGPGVAGTIRVGVAGLPAGFEELWRANRALFPRGVDMIFATGDAIMGLPRSTRVLAGDR